MTDSPVFTGTSSGDLVRVVGPAAVLTARLQAAGWQVVELAVGDEPEFHRRIAAGLGFPGHYGANLDALWDCLTDLTTPAAVVWEGWQELADARPQRWSRLLGVLRDRATDPPEREPAFAVVLVDPAG